jgi:DNA invertase Pin-like site-specific DNA recombinase
MERVIGYTRVSTDEQASSGAGLAAQRAAILAEAERRGWHLVEVIEDAGFSGKDLRRPGIAVVLEALRKRRADVLVVAKLDRLSRSLLDLAGLMAVATKEHWALVALDVNVDTTTASGRAMAGMMGVFAQLERDMIGERTKSALTVKRAQGVRLGRPPTLPPAVVQRIETAREAGQTWTAIAEALNLDGVPTAHGGREWYPSTVTKVARSAEAARHRRVPG